MPLPRLIVILPCTLAIVSFLLELCNITFLLSRMKHDRSIWNFCLGMLTLLSLTSHIEYRSNVFISVSFMCYQLTRTNEYCSLVCDYNSLFLGHCCLSSYYNGNIDYSSQLDIFHLCTCKYSLSIGWHLFTCSYGKYCTIGKCFFSSNKIRSSCRRCYCSSRSIIVKRIKFIKDNTHCQCTMADIHRYSDDHSISMTHSHTIHGERSLLACVSSRQYPNIDLCRHVHRIHNLLFVR
jgi:hypothetical protein